MTTPEEQPLPARVATLEAQREADARRIAERESRVDLLIKGQQRLNDRTSGLRMAR